MSHDCRETLARISHDCRETRANVSRLSHGRETLARMSHDCRETLARMSHDCRASVVNLIEYIALAIQKSKEKDVPLRYSDPLGC